MTLASLTITLRGRPYAKKNNPQAYCISGCRGWSRGQGSQPKKIIIPSKEYLTYEKDALKQLMQWGNVYFDGQVQVCALYFMPDKRSRPDLLGLLQATADILEKSGLIVNDRLIVSWDGSRIVGLDKEAPRVEITICEAQAPEWA